jgi:hypothetical protein
MIRIVSLEGSYSSVIARERSAFHNSGQAEIYKKIGLSNEKKHYIIYVLTNKIHDITLNLYKV